MSSRFFKTAAPFRLLQVRQRSWPGQTIRGFKQSREAGKKSLTPVEEVHGTRKTFRDLTRPLAFTLLVSGTSFAGCAVWQYEALRRNIKDAMNKGHIQDNQFYGKVGGWREQINTMWNQLNNGQKLVSGIIAINTAIYLMWKISPIQATMIKFFRSTPVSGAVCWSMLLSTFSHYSSLHLAANMYVLWSFTPTITSLLGREQFLAMYLSAGVISSLTSYVAKIARASAVPSIGASGAIMAVLGAVCCYYPDARLSVAFVDQIYPHSFSAGSAMKGIIVFDTLGVLLRWRLFDHAAHLGGMLFGLWYISYGHKLIWQHREKMIKCWHQMRGKP